MNDGLESVESSDILNAVYHQKQLLQLTLSTLIIIMHFHCQILVDSALCQLHFVKAQ